MVSASRAAEETVSALTTNLVRTGILPTPDAVGFPERRLGAPDMKLVPPLVLLNGSIRDVDLERHGGRGASGAGCC